MTTLSQQPAGACQRTPPLQRRRVTRGSASVRLELAGVEMGRKTQLFRLRVEGTAEVVVKVVVVVESGGSSLERPHHSFRPPPP